MTHGLSTVKRLMIGAVAVGSMALTTAGVAAAAPSGSAAKGASHFNCARATKVLARIQATEARIARRLPQLNAAETKAKQNGNTKRADRISRRIARLENPSYKARLDKRKAKIEAKCQVSAPPAGKSSNPPSGTTGPAGNHSILV
jgi:hypothetical protein